MKPHRVDSYHIGPADGITLRQAAEILALLRRTPAGPPEALGGRGRIVRGTVEGIGAVVIKAYRRGGAIRHFNRALYLGLGKTRAEREYEMLACARRAGVAAPEPLAYAWQGRGLYRAWLVTREIAGAVTLAELSRKAPERLPFLAPAVAGQVRRLVRAGIRHADLHPGNVLVGPGGKVHLVDLDKSRRFSGDPRRLWAECRRRWGRAVAKHRLPPALNAMLPAPAAEDGPHGSGEPAGPATAGGPSILVVLMGSLGDVARGLCLLAPLKDRFPNGRITWLVEPKCAGLVRIHPLIDEVLVFERRWHPAPVRALWQALGRRHFDIALDLQRHFKSGFFSRLSRAQRRIGFDRKNAKELNWIFNNEHIAPCPESLPKIRHYLMFAERLGAAAPARLDFGLAGLMPPAAGPGAPPELQALRRPYIAVALGSSWPSKDWSAEGYGALVAKILDRGGFGVALLGDRSQAPLAARLGSGTKAPGLVDLTGKTTLPQLAAVLKAAAAAVGPDCGSGHLAAAVGTPYVSLFGPTAPSRTAPYGSEHLVVRAPADCAPCYRRRCPVPGHPCMDGIRFEDVMERLEAALRADKAPN